MKKTSLLLISMIAVGSLSAVFSKDQSRAQAVSENHLKSKSQSDTEIDQSSAKDTMDYFIAAMVDVDLNQVKENVSDFKNMEPNSVIDDRLFEKYLEYKSALEQIDYSNNYSNLSIEALTELHEFLMDQQAYYFTVSEQELLFAHDNRMRELAIEKLKLRQEYSDPVEFERKWLEALSLQPEYVQQTQKNALVLSQLSSTNSLDNQHKYLNRVEIVGESAAQRLSALDAERAQFDSDFQQFIAQRETILDNPSLSTEEQSHQVAALRGGLFPEQQLKRVEALERIHDSGNN
ncbi:lipase chaperone [Vibrio sp. D404a]|uniref:lipase secretion chaperone n=1 Tax=unclassified Vibrio TaxID=2614977 RepID=UPI0025533475|nr:MULTISPECIES: lipase secretion chaperone [unclassified Vibrio]MDK9736242.1 lipase chaperone [Vibrio sp. D404a]MDK9795864.1 lipase chaperone [Vibrio sp. D449a]